MKLEDEDAPRAIAPQMLPRRNSSLTMTNDANRLRLIPAGRILHQLQRHSSSKGIRLNWMAGAASYWS